MSSMRWLLTGGMVGVGALFLLASLDNVPWLWGLALAGLILLVGLGLFNLGRSLWEEWNGSVLSRRSPARERLERRRASASQTTQERSQAAQPPASSSGQQAAQPEPAHDPLFSFNEGGGEALPEPLSETVKLRHNGHKKHPPEA